MRTNDLFLRLIVTMLLHHFSRPSIVVPLVYVFLLKSPACKDYHLPPYLWSSFNQSANFQHRDTPIIFITDAVNCSSTKEAMGIFSNRITLMDASLLNSTKSLVFSNNSLIGRGELNLYLTSIQRFFILEDLMNLYNYSQVFHVEADNLLYFSLMDMLRFTASVMKIDEFRGSQARPNFW